MATRFLQAYGAFNEERAIAYLAADTDISGLMEAVGAESVDGTLKELRLLTSFLEAQRYEQMLDSCDRTGSSSSGTAVRCMFDFHLFGSDEIGLGPFHGSYFDLTVRDGEIVRASKHWGIGKFSPQVWEPFADWVSATYPRDAAVMYTDGAYDYARLSERSMRLWEQRIHDYVVVERASTSDEAAPELTAGQAVAAGQKVVELSDRNIRDMTPGVPAPKAPYLIDLTTREMTRLPEAIIRSLGTGRFTLSGNPDLSIDARGFARFAASPDGSSLAFVGVAEDGSPQIFISDLTGIGVLQVTHDPTGAMAPAWSPDGTKIAYEGYAGGGGRPHVFVLDLASGESRQITFHDPACPGCLLGPQFTPDGSSIIYTGGTASAYVVRTIPVAGGRSAVLLGPDEKVSAGLGGLTHWASASVSPDGSLVTFVGSGYVAQARHCDRCRFLANADGTDKRIITGWTASPSGAWSPDSTRIVAAGNPEPPFPIVVVDAMTGEVSKVADGPATAAIWLNEHTLLVDA